MSTQEPTVLVVDDESSLVEIYAHWLREYTVRTAKSGEKALEVIDDEVDIVILDRIMPGIAGDVVINTIRDRDLDCMIVVATAVEPDLELIVEGADMNLTKPISENEIQTAVTQALNRREYEKHEQEYFDLLSERAVLKANDDEYAELDARIESLQIQLKKHTETMDDSEFISLINSVSN